MNLDEYFAENSIFRSDQGGFEDFERTDRNRSNIPPNETDLDKYFSKESIFRSDQQDLSARRWDRDHTTKSPQETDVDKYFPKESIFRSDKNRQQDFNARRRDGDYSKMSPNETDLDKYFSKESIFRSDQNVHQDADARAKKEYYTEKLPKETYFDKPFSNHSIFRSEQVVYQDSNTRRRDRYDSVKSPNETDLDKYFSKESIFKSDQKRHPDSDAHHKNVNHTEVQSKEEGIDECFSEESIFRLGPNGRSDLNVRHNEGNQTEMQPNVAGLVKYFSKGINRNQTEHQEVNANFTRVERQKNETEKCHFSEEVSYKEEMQKSGFSTKKKRELMSQRSFSCDDLLDLNPDTEIADRFEMGIKMEEIQNSQDYIHYSNVKNRDDNDVTQIDTQLENKTRRPAFLPFASEPGDGSSKQRHPLVKKKSVSLEDLFSDTKFGDARRQKGSNYKVEKLNRTTQFQIRNIRSNIDCIISNGDESCWVFIKNEQILLKVGPKGEVLENIRTPAHVIDDVTVDPDGNIYFSCHHEKQIIRIDAIHRVSSLILLSFKKRAYILIFKTSGKYQKVLRWTKE